MKPLYYLWISVLLTIHAGIARAQQAQGTVYGHDSLPVPGAAVTNIHSHATILTGQDGKFSIPARAGDTLLIQALGHLPFPAVVGTGFFRIFLHPKIEQLAGVEIRHRKRHWIHWKTGRTIKRLSISGAPGSGKW